VEPQVKDSHPDLQKKTAILRRFFFAFF